jgi:hypothetical protein
MFENNLLTFHGLELKVSDHANEGILDILNNTIQGSEGGMRFALQNIASKIAAYGDQIRFVSLYRKNKVTGTAGACFRISGQNELRYPTTYIRYLAFQQSYQSGAGWKIKEKKSSKEATEDTFKQKTLEVFSKPHLLGLPGISENGSHIMYAFVESMNERSKNLVHQAGYEYIRSFLTVAFSRFNPKTDKRVSRIPESETGKMKELLLDFYRDYSFFTTDYAFYGNRYYILREGGEIIAGVCAIPSLYKVYNVPGVWGWIMMKVLPYVPYYRRLFRPGEFRYLVFDTIYYKKGREDALTSLFESACASEGFHTGLTWLDDRSALYDTLRTEVNMGTLNRMLNAKPGLVYARFLNLTEEEKNLFYDAPAYVSGFDFS